MGVFYSVITINNLVIITPPPLLHAKSYSHLHIVVRIPNQNNKQYRKDKRIQKKTSEKIFNAAKTMETTTKRTMRYQRHASHSAGICFAWFVSSHLISLSCCCCCCLLNDLRVPVLIDNTTTMRAFPSSFSPSFPS